MKNIINQQLIRFLDRLARTEKISHNLVLVLENFYSLLKRTNTKFGYDQTLRLFTAQEGKLFIYFSNRYRGLHLYRKGLKNRGNFIYNSYCLNRVIFNDSDIVIDCGANYGDLYINLKPKIKPENYIAIEPSPENYKILQRNMPKESILINSALGRINSDMKFYISDSSGDSSLVKPAQFTDIINIPVIRLDKLLNDLAIKKIKLLKIDAEGYEPEILHGLGSEISRCEYISLDGGYERGILQEQTLTTCINYLLLNNFVLIDIYFPWCRALFKKVD